MFAVPERLARLLRRMADSCLDLLLITDPVNVGYLVGRSDRRNGSCLVGPDLFLFSCDFKTSFAEIPTLEVDQIRPVDTASLARLVPALQGAVGYDDEHLTYRVFRELEASVAPSCRLVAAGSLMPSLREKKDLREVAAIRRAAGLVDEALEQLAGEGWVGKSEHQLAARVEEIVLRLGADGIPFPTAVISGTTSAQPHARPSKMRTVEPNQPVLVDMGCIVDGYASDCTRMFVTGGPPSRFIETYALVLAAQEEGLAAIRPGVRCADVDRSARSVIDTAGYASHFGHGLGHGVGLDIHEGPRLSRTSTQALRAGNVVTVEPGVYLEGAFGIRIEDLVAVTSSGYENMTAFPKQAPTIVD